MTPKILYSQSKHGCRYFIQHPPAMHLAFVVEIVDNAITCPVDIPFLHEIFVTLSFREFKKIAKLKCRQKKVLQKFAAAKMK